MEHPKNWSAWRTCDVMLVLMVVIVGVLSAITVYQGKPTTPQACDCQVCPCQACPCEAEK